MYMYIQKIKLTKYLLEDYESDKNNKIKQHHFRVKCSYAYYLTGKNNTSAFNLKRKELKHHIYKYIYNIKLSKSLLEDHESNKNNKKNTKQRKHSFGIRIFLKKRVKTALDRSPEINCYKRSQFFKELVSN